MEDFLKRCSEAVNSYDSVLAEELAQEALDRGFDLAAVIEEGYGRGLARAGKLWEEGEYFLPELMMASEAMKAAMTRLAPAMEKSSTRRNPSRSPTAPAAGDTSPPTRAPIPTIQHRQEQARGFPKLSSI